MDALRILAANHSLPPAIRLKRGYAALPHGGGHGDQHQHRDDGDGPAAATHKTSMTQPCP